ncbi:MAG: alpha/beta fold hydrolase [Candidatus Latescibacterota bacterium]|nr:alpha/beta fold hydrolase [Candidatus Latescibacterota bacterium]
MKRTTEALLTALLVYGCASEISPSREELIEALRLRAYRGEITAEVISQSSRRDIIRERVEFQGRHDQRIPALVAYSELARARPLPVLLCMPGSPNSKEDLIQPLDLLTTWAEEGFFVISIDRPYHGERDGNPEAAIRSKGLPRVLGEYVYDLGRTIDYVETRPEADVSRLGMLGLSMGGMEALLLAAVDDRVDAVVSIAGQLSWEEVFAEGAWKLIFTGLPLTEQLLARQADGAEAHRAFLEITPDLRIVDAPGVAARIAPRPLLIMTGEEDPYVTPAGALRTFRTARVSYEIANRSDALAFWIEEGMGHGFSDAMRQRALRWFQRWLVPLSEAPS